MSNGFYFSLPFGTSGDQSTIPWTGTAAGVVNYTYGYGTNYSASVETDPDSLLVDRLTFNNLMYSVTLSLQGIYQQGLPSFITAAQNQSVAYSYGLGALVQQTDGFNYYSVSAANTVTPGTDPTKWIVFNPQYYSHKGLVPLASVTGGTYSFASNGTGCTLTYTVSGAVINAVSSVAAGGTGYSVGDLLTPNAGNYDAVIRVATLSGSAVATVTILYGGTGFIAGTAVGTQRAKTSRKKISLAGVLASNATFILPNGAALTFASSWIIANNTTGAFSVTFFVSNGSNVTTGTGVLIQQASSTNSAEVNIDTDGSTDVWLSSPSTTIGTPLATTSGTSATVTNIPTNARKVTLNLVGVTTASSSGLLQLGTSGAIISTGYSSGAINTTTAGVSAGLTSTAGFVLNGATGAYVYSGSIILTLENATNNTWCVSGTLLATGPANSVVNVSGSVSLSGALAQLKLTTSSGVALFSAGEINTSYQ